MDVQNFSHSWKDGLALCALIHRHRPDLLNYDALDKTDAHANTRLAFETAQQHLGIPQLLDVEDLCDAAKPDERSVMTYVAQYFHAFSSMEQAEVVSRRVATFADVMQSAWLMQHDYERRAREVCRQVHVRHSIHVLTRHIRRPVLAVQLLAAMLDVESAWSSAIFQGTYADARAQLTTFNTYKHTTKRAWVRERTDLAGLLGNIQTKLKTYNLREWVPAHGLAQADIDAAWEALAAAEARRSRSINAEIRNAKETLRKRFAALANAFEGHLRELSARLAALDGPLEEQLDEARRVQTQLAPLANSRAEIAAVDAQCNEANVEENDHTVFTLDDLQFELELVTTSVAKKLAFIENQVRCCIIISYKLCGRERTLLRTN